MFGAIWTILTLPFRLIVGLFDFLSRATGLVLGFALMVLGVALGDGPSPVLGVPIFAVGLVLTLRCLGFAGRSRPPERPISRSGG